jgi:transposase
MPLEPGRPITPTLPTFDVHIPGREYDTPHEAGLHSIWAWEEYNGRKEDNEEIFRFLKISRTQGYEILKAESGRTFNNHPIDNLRKRPRKTTSEQASEIAFLLDTRDDAQHLSWQLLGMEVGVEATEKIVRTALKREGINTRIATVKPLLHSLSRRKEVERDEDRLVTHGDWKPREEMIFSDEVHFSWSDQGRLYINAKLKLVTNLDIFNIHENLETKTVNDFILWLLLAGI